MGGSEWRTWSEKVIGLKEAQSPAVPAINSLSGLSSCDSGLENLKRALSLHLEMAAMNDSGVELVYLDTFVYIGQGIKEDIIAVVAGSSLYGV